MVDPGEGRPQHSSATKKGVLEVHGVDPAAHGDGKRDLASTPEVKEGLKDRQHELPKSKRNSLDVNLYTFSIYSLSWEYIWY